MNDPNDFENNKRQPGTWSSAKGRKVDGQDVIESSHGYKRNPDGSVGETDLKHLKRFADGIYRPPSEWIGVSWTGEDIPRDSLCECANHFGIHSLRIGFRKVDMFDTTPKGKEPTTFCTECFEINKTNAKIKRWLWYLGLGFIYREEIY